MKYFSKLFLIGCFLGCCLPLSVAAATEGEVATPAARPLKADIQLIVVPIRAKSILAGGTVNALEKPASEMPPVWTTVLFRVERILSGDFKVPKNQEISLWSQMKDAADDKNFFKILTMDFARSPEDGTDKGWLSMAVIDPYASFGIREGEEPAARQRYKLSLARVRRDPESFVLVKSEKLGS